MQRVLSTYRYIRQPLAPPVLAEIARGGISSIEIFCAPSHFSYRAPEKIRELADALSEYGLTLHSLHSPTERDLAPGRESGVPLSISDTERIRRLDAVDEVKRALEVAERIPFRYLVQHMGHGRESADPKRTDAAFSSLENLAVFAKARGVTIALENTPDELGAPASLRQFIAETHLHDLRLCFDIGHAHLESGVEAGMEAMRERVVTTHIHDNHGEKDEHLLPFEGSVNWEIALAALAAASEPLPIVLELKEQPAGMPSLDQIRAVFDKLEKTLEARRPRAARS
ncbi:MAG TPA: sugar phosphate isomerase/epimerase family protein [Candidatus Sulfotelmatobacter sp.]|nr:sugar phosphate isomerase/epimerase family protein [Candidatus Sulfotelmatobacter sp.]